jgi:hypothetical protein
MILYDTTDKSGIFNEMDEICNSDPNSFPLESKLRRVNNALDRFMTLAFRADGRWSYDDVSQGADPIETQDLVQDQQVYALSDFTSEILKLLRVEILKEDSTAIVLRRLKRENIHEALTEYKAESNTPDEYDVFGNSIYLYPPPSYDLGNGNGGLKIYFNRNAVRLTSSDYSEELSIPSLFHSYIARQASIPYLIENQKAQKNDVFTQTQVDEKEILHHFSNREKGISDVITMEEINSV